MAALWQGAPPPPQPGCRQLNVLSIQSSVAYGHVGNAAACLPLQRLGHEVWAIDTVHFSNHPAHGAWRGRAADPEEVAALIAGIGERGAFAECAAVLSGYLGRPETGPVVLEAVAAVKAANPKALYACDPVMGDHDSGFYVEAGIPEFFGGQAVAQADILFPNAFELGYLAGCDAATVAGAVGAARALLEHGPRLVVVTGLRDSGTIRTLAVTPAEAWRVETPLIDARAYGAGDAFAAVFLARYLETGMPAAALEHATSAAFAVVEATAAAGSLDLALLAAQDAFVRPPRLFPAQEVR